MTPERLKAIITSLNRRQPDLTVIMENVIKPHNLAAVARTSDAVGALDIHAITPRKSIRLTQMSAGGVKKWIRVKTHSDTVSGIKSLQQQGMQVIATHLSEYAKDYRKIDYTKPTAILVGEELEGISEQALSLADECVTIPMAGLVQSLNVSVASALLLYEAYHQRDALGMYDERRIDDDRYYQLLFEWCHPIITRYCKQKKISYPKINDQAEIMEPLANSTTWTEDGFADWMRKKNL